MTPTKLQTELLAEYMNQLCPCRLIAVTTEHKKKECPHYTFSMERDFLLSALQRQRAQALQEARDAVVGEKEYKNKTPLFGENEIFGWNAARGQTLENLSKLNEIR